MLAPVLAVLSDNPRHSEQQRTEAQKVVIRVWNERRNKFTVSSFR